MHESQYINVRIRISFIAVAKQTFTYPNQNWKVFSHSRSFIIHHMLASVIASNFFRFRSRFQHQQTFYILIYCAIYGFQLQKIHFFFHILLFLFFMLWLFSSFFVFIIISLDSFTVADFICFSNSISELSV